MLAPRVIAFPLAAGLFALWASTLVAAQGQPEQRSAPAPQAESVRLARLLELAASGRFYLVLDPEPGQLTLMYQGAVLREFPVLKTEVGRRRALFTARPLPGDWADSVWHEGKLDPARRLERLEIDPPDSTVAAESLPVTIPPTPEDAIPAPDRFFIRYRDRRAIEIVAHEPTSAGGGRQTSPPSASLGERLIYTLAPWRRPQVILRLHIPAADARALYRALPENGEFLLLYTPKGAT